MRLKEYINEGYGVKDVRWFENLPDYKPPLKLKKLEKKFNLKIRWKYAGKSFKYSRYMHMLNMIVIVENGEKEKTLLHELGHGVYQTRKKDWVRSFSRYIKDNYKAKIKGFSYKTIKFDNANIFAYSHSGTMYEDEEIFATCFELYHNDYEFPDKKITKAFELILDKGHI